MKLTGSERGFDQTATQTNTSTGAVNAVHAADTSITVAGTSGVPTVKLTPGAGGTFDVAQYGAAGDAVLSTTMTATATSTTITDPNLQTFSGSKTIVISGAGTNPGGGFAPYGFKTTFTCTVAGTGTLASAATTSVGPVSCVQTLTETGSPTGGTFTLTWQGQTTTALNYNAAASDVQAALVALSTIGTGNVVCAGGALNSAPITITFQGTLASQQLALPVVTKSLTGGTSPAVTPTTTTAGSAGMAVYGTDDTTAIQNAINAAALASATTGQKCIVSGRAGLSYLVPFGGSTLSYGSLGSIKLALEIKANVVLQGLSLSGGDYTGTACCIIGDAPAGTSGWAVRDCTFNGMAMANPSTDQEYLHEGIVFGNASNVRIYNNSFKLMRQSAIVGVAQTGGIPTQLRIHDNTITLCNGGALKLQSGVNFAWIRDNHIAHNLNVWALGGSGTGAECIFLNSTTNNFYIFIRDNYVVNWGSCLAMTLQSSIVNGNFLAPAQGGACMLTEGGTATATIAAGNILSTNPFASNAAIEWIANNCLIAHNLHIGPNGFPTFMQESAACVGNAYIDNLIYSVPGNVGRYNLNSSSTGTRVQNASLTAGGVEFSGGIPSTPSVPATATGLQNTFACDVTCYLVGGGSTNVTAIAVAYGGYTSAYVTTGLTIGANGQATVFLKAGDYIKLTYGAGAGPTGMVWVPVL